MTTDARQRLEQLQQELAALDEAKHDAPPSTADPKGQQNASERKAALLAEIRSLQEQLS